MSELEPICRDTMRVPSPGAGAEGALPIPKPLRFSELREAVLMAPLDCIPVP